MPRRIVYDPDHDYYQILGIESNAQIEVIQQAYRQKAKQLHPDLNQDRVEWAKEQFQLLNEAYSVLSDPGTKRLYDDLRWPYQTFGRTSSESSQSAPRRETRSPSWTDRPYRYRPRPRPPATEPGVWLKQVGLGGLQPLYRAAVGLLTSPYRYILGLLTLILAINMIILIGVIAFGEGVSVGEGPDLTLSTTPGQNVSGVLPTATVAPSVTPVLTTINCGPYLQITSPTTGAVLSEVFGVPVQGRINNPDMFSYEVVAISDTHQISLREQKTVREAPVDSGELVSLDLLQGQDSGEYEIRILVYAKGGHLLNQCAVMIHKD